MGKTTCAAATAVALAARGRRVLTVSTDPAHSLGDVLGLQLSSRPRHVPLWLARSRGGGTLQAAEIDAARAFSRWLGAHRLALAEIVEQGTWLDREDVDALLNLSIPGIDELAGLIEIVRLATSEYDEVVVDTAPTGHTLRLIASPDTVAAVAAVLDALYEKHRLIRDQLARVGLPGAADHLIELLAEQARETAALLRDRRRASFQWVTLPEEMSLAEAVDGIGALERARITVAGVIVNRATAPGPPCPICDRRRAAELRVIELTDRRFGRQRSLAVVPARLTEPRGVPALRQMGKYLSPAVVRSRLRESPDRRTREGAQIRQPPKAPALSIRDDARSIAPEALEVFRDVRLLFFGGKGGVGKTTSAAAVALRLARATPRNSVLLLSTDPAHSLSDVFGQPIGDLPVRLRGGPSNLHVRELDAAAALASHREGLEAALNEISAALGANVGDITGGRGAGELMDLAPPGIDELFGLVSVVEARSKYPLIVMDTAPTGHALRLLEMPDAARDWVQVLLRVLLKYRSLVRPGRLASQLVDLSKSIRELQALLRNPRDTRFAVVTRAAAVPRLETERLIGRLRRLGLAAPAVIVNAMTLGPGRCPQCRKTAAAERRELTALERRLPPAGRPRRGPHARQPRVGSGSGSGAGVPCVIIQTPLSAPPPRGHEALERWAASWIVHDHRTDLRE